MIVVFDLRLVEALFFPRGLTAWVVPPGSATRDRQVDPLRCGRFSIEIKKST